MTNVSDWTMEEGERPYYGCLVDSSTGREGKLHVLVQMTGWDTDDDGEPTLAVEASTFCGRTLQEPVISDEVKVTNDLCLRCFDEDGIPRTFVP